MIEPPALPRRPAPAGLLLGGCDRLNNSPTFRGVLRSAERLTMASQRLISARDALAREFSEADMSPVFRSNGTRDARRRRLCAACWPSLRRLAADRRRAGRAAALAPDPTLRAMPHRTQITRHDCVEGWSAIGKWTGVPLSLSSTHAGLSTRAKYIVFHCADRFGDKPYYESIDLVDAFHPQTILAWGMNGHLLPVAQRRARCASGSSASSATSRPNTSMRIEARRQPRRRLRRQGRLLGG